MTETRQNHAPAIEFGMASACLGSIGLFLFFLPILSIPVALCGFLAGVAGVVRGLNREPLGVRWSLIGCALSLSVATIGFIVAYAPIGELPSYSVPSQEWRSPDRFFVSPPTR